MAAESTQNTSCRSERHTPSAPTQSRRTREWKSDQEYVEDQDRDTTWSTFDRAWGDSAAAKFVIFGETLEKSEQLCHNDKVADFGGNDGWASFCFYSRHKIKPLVVDCEPKRLEFAAKNYHLPTLRTFIEDMPMLADKSIDWGFTSHTMEHTRDTAKALREIARVIKRGCFFVLPLENLHHARRNHAHAICFTKASGWTKLMEANGWIVKAKSVPCKFEAHVYAEPK